MKEDVLKFRKCVEILVKEKKSSSAKIIQEMGISEPTFYKILKSDIAEMKIQSSVLGIIQDFNRKHCNDINYAGIEPATLIEGDKEKETNKLRKNLSNYQEPRKEKEKEKEVEIHTDEQKGNHSSEILEQTSNPFDLFLEALKSVPSNVTIHIFINDK